jgi:hypothetical protein
MNRTKPYDPGVPRTQTRPSTPPDAREAGTARPAVGRKLEIPPDPQRVPQNVKPGVGVTK